MIEIIEVNEYKEVVSTLNKLSVSFKRKKYKYGDK